ncbi:terpene synthase 02 [Abeliophyllum distichum]|uniref:Terpene synthase 02 n=1 Tax=Abeliophyllum distichum TaxID=126358 RepID=A0ABD1PBA3_9LAMI
MLGERYIRQASELKMQVKMMLDEAMEPLDQLDLIDNLQRLGISYHFEDDIKHILTIINRKYSKNREPGIKDLYATAFEFRLLRQHGFKVSQDIFDCFKNEKGDFKTSICEDTKGLLQLYEASFLSTEGETTLELAREFTIKHLQDQIVDQYSSLLVQHALEFPLHKTIPRAEARWWKRTCLAEKLPFARDRLVECFFCTIGGLFEPQYGFCRTILTKVMSLLTVIDDIYDVYGTLEELELFTCAIERWDVNTIEQLPDYMQICYLAVVNFVNEIAYDILKDRGLVIIPYLRKAWTDICKAYLQEAKWYFNGYTPTLEEYMKNACITISAHVIMSHAFFSVTNPIEKEAVEYLQKYPVVIHWLATILRLADDLATSSDELKRGDTPKSIRCYMNETAASEDDARKHVKFLISETWKKLNKDGGADCPFSQTFIEIAKNTGRMSQYMYQYGDGHGMSNSETKDRILALVFEPILLA